MDYLVHHLLRSSTLRSPDGEAVVDGLRRLTFARAARCVEGVADGLREAGVRRSDRVGVFLDPSLELALSLFGISQAGGVFVPIHHSLFPSQIEHVALDCGMVGLITDAKKLAGLADALRACPSLRFVLVVGGPEPAVEVVTAPLQYAWEAWANANASCGAEIGLGSDLAAILYTSGSTGKPKGVMLSHANVIAGASIVSEYLEITHRDRLLAALPFSFDAGLNQLTTSIQQGAACVLIKFLFAREVVSALAGEAITGLAGVPPLWNLMAQPSSGLEHATLPCLRYITNTGGALPQKTLAQLRRALPATRVYLMYGLTEAFRSTYLPPEELDRRPTSMGKAIPNTEILVVRENGELAGPGEVGELVHHGPTVSLGYWGCPDVTRQVFRPHPLSQPGGADRPMVCYSGDLVRRDDAGFLYFVGRRDNLIKSAGFRISPTEVEEVLCRSGQLRDAAVVGVPDDLLGQRVIGFVTPRDGRAVDSAELAAWCAAHMPRHMVPRAIHVRDLLPKTPSGKIDYASLRIEATHLATAGAPTSDGEAES